MALCVVIGLLVSLPLSTSAQGCQPRPPVRITSLAAGPGRLNVTVTAGSGTLQSLTFAGGGNAQVEIDGQTRQPPFTYPVPAGTAQKTFGVVRNGGAGTPVTLSFTVTDACGPWSTFVGGGGAAWEAPLSGQVVNAGDGQPLGGATVQIEGTSLTATTGGDGRFSINQVPKGNQSLKTMASGFLADTRTVEVGAAGGQIVGLHRPSSANLATSAGTNVVVAPDTSAGSGVARASVTFSNVTTPGTTTIERTELPPGQVPPSGGAVHAGAYYGIATTAATSGTVEIAVPYDPTALGTIDPSQLRLMRVENGAWVDRTTDVDIYDRVVRGGVPNIASGASSRSIGPSALGFEVIALVNNLHRAIIRAPTPLQGAPTPPPIPPRVIIFIPGISLGCGQALIGLLGLQTLCDITDSGLLTIPYSAVDRGRRDFSEIRRRITSNDHNPRYIDWNGSGDLTGGSLRYFSYAADFQANGQYKPENTRQYKPENTRQSLATSSRLLGEQIRHWGTDGITYDIVGHSLGGAVATHWLATETDPATRRAVRSIVTMDSPVNGARNAQGEAARWLSLSGQAGLDLQDNSAGGTIAKMGAALASGKVVTLANTRDLVVVSTTSYEVGTCPDSLSGCLFDLGFLTADAAKLWHFGILQASEPMIRLDKVLAGVSVTGQVIDSVTQQGVGDATVELVDVVLSTVTNADGTFTLQSVPPSTKQQTLRVSKSGYQTRADITVTANTTGPISLPAPIQLTSTTGTLTGTVTAGMGGPGLDGVSVQVQGTTGSATTGNGGQFSFIGMLPGTYTILASREGYQSGSQSVTIGAGANPPITIPLTLISTRVQRVTVVGSTQANSSSDLPTISGDGRYVAFFSHASNLVPNDTNGVSDIFVWDRLTRTTERVSVAADGTQANERSVAVSINTDGRYVAFQSLASNLVPGDTNDHADIFVKDRSTGVVERVSTTSDGSQLAISVSADPSISGDGRYVAFRVDAPELSPPPRHVHVYVKDRQTGLTVRASETAAGVPGNGSSHSAQISANGRYVAFSSSAENLVPGSTDGIGDVYLKDLQTGAIIRASAAADGAQANAGGVQPALSADGRFVAFYSDATNLVSGDTNGERDVFVKDRDTGQVHRVNVANDGSQADETSSTTDISSDGRFVVFNSLARNLVPGDTVFRFDVFIVDRQAGTIQRVSTPVNGLQSNGDSTRPRVSADGRFVVFWSDSTNLIAGDTNSTSDIFIVDLSVPISP